MKKLKVTVGELYNIEQSILAADVMKMMFSRKGSLCLLRNMKKMESKNILMVMTALARNQNVGANLLQHTMS